MQLSLYSAECYIFRQERTVRSPVFVALLLHIVLFQRLLQWPGLRNQKMAMGKCSKRRSALREARQVVSRGFEAVSPNCEGDARSGVKG